MTNAFLLALVLPLAFAYALVSGWFLVEARGDLREALARTATTLLLPLELYLEEHRAAVDTFADLLELAPEVREPEGLGPWVAAFARRHPGFRSLRIGDPAGAVVAPGAGPGAAAPPAPGPGPEAPSSPVAAEARRTVLSGAFAGPAAGEVSVAISRSFAWGDGQRGLVQGILDLAGIDELVRQGTPERAWTILVLDGDDTVVASSGARVGPLVPLASVRDTLDEWAPDFRAGARSSATGWRIVALAAPRALYEPLLVFGGAMATVVLASTLVAGWLFRRFQFPVVSWISRVSRRFAAGEVDAIEVPPVPASATDELRQLARALEELLATVVAQRGQLREHLATLENRVRERTLAVEQANRELTHSRALLEQFVRQAPVALVLFDRELRFLAVSDRWLRDFELGDTAVEGRPLAEVLPDLAERWRERHARCIAGQVQRVEEEPLPRPDGSIEWIRWAMEGWRNPAGEIAGTVMMAEFVTEKKRLRDQLRHLADHDSLTGLLNRRAFLDLLERTLARPGELSHALLFIDLDDFKRVNDRFGHHTGDDVLRLLGDRLRRRTRHADVAGRLGGDEFVILARVGTREELPSLLARYRELLSADVRCERGRVEVTVSVGSLWLAAGMGIEDALVRADEAMYADKRRQQDADPPSA